MIIGELASSLGSPGSTVGAVLVATILVFLLILRSPLRKVPGPWYTQWTDLALKYHHLSGTKPVYTLKLHKKYGPVVRISPTEVDVSDPTAATVIHQVKKPYLKTKFYGQFQPGFESLFSTLDLDFHRSQRRLLSGPLSDTQLKRFWPQIVAKVDLMISQMKAEADRRGAVDIFKWYLFFTTDVVGELSFGESFNMLEQGEINDYIKDLQLAQSIGGIRLAMPSLLSLPIARSLPFLREANAVSDRLQGHAAESLRRHRQIQDRQGPDASPTVLDKMYASETLTPKHIQDQAQENIVAGSDTTSNTLTYLTWSICQRPALRSRLVAELRERLPDDDMTNEDLKALPFLNNAIRETLRLFSAIPGALPRYVPPEGAELAGVRLPGGSTVMTSPYCLHRDPAVFPDPEGFDPDRWEDATREMRDSFMPFGGGTRTCAGMHLAMSEIRLGAAKFFLAYPDARVSTREGMSDADMDPSMYFLLAPKGHRCLVELN